MSHLISNKTRLGHSAKREKINENPQIEQYWSCPATRLDASWIKLRRDKSSDAFLYIF